MESPVVAFFAPFSGLTGRTALFFSFVSALADGKGAVSVGFERVLFPSLSERVRVIDWNDFRPRAGDRETEVNQTRSDESLVRTLAAHQTNDKNLLALTIQPDDLSDLPVSLLSRWAGPTVLDLHETRLDLASVKETLLEEVSLSVIAITPSLEDVGRAKTLIGRLVSLGFSTQRLKVLLFNAAISGGLTVATIRNEIGPDLWECPFDYALALRSENEGRLIQELNPRSSMTRSFHGFAREILSFFKSKDKAIATGAWSPEKVRALEKMVIAGLWQKVQETGGPDDPAPHWLSTQIDREIESVLLREGAPPDAGEVDDMRCRMKDHVMGFGPLEKLWKDTSINEIMINGRDIYIERDGKIEPGEENFETEKQLRIVIDRMVGRVGRRVDLSSPMCDVRLADGSRVNVILPPLSLSGPVVTIRRFRPQIQTMDDLIQKGTLAAPEAEFLRQAVEKRQNILIAGNTGAGKTTLLNVLSGYAASGERIITLEDTAELQLRQRHVVRLETRPKNAEGVGEIGMADLLINALRMRPDRIIIGECRGNEVVPMLQAMNTGHDGSLTTLHSNSAFDAIRRLESMVLLAAPQWPVSVVRQQIAAALDLIIYLKRTGHERKVTEIVNLEFDDGEIHLSSADALVRT